MKRVFLLLLLFAFAACKKNEDDLPVYVSYKITETSQDAPVYSVSYTADGGVTKSIGGISAPGWSSESVKMKHGDYASINLRSQDGAGSFTMAIYVNGSLWKQETADNPNADKTISGEIP
jgi:hypothetical protein